MTTRLCSSISNPRRRAWRSQTPVLFSTTVASTNRKSGCLKLLSAAQITFFTCSFFFKWQRSKNAWVKGCNISRQFALLSTDIWSWISRQLEFSFLNNDETNVFLKCRKLYCIHKWTYWSFLLQCICCSSILIDNTVFPLRCFSGACHVWAVPTSATGANTGMTAPTTLAHAPSRRDESRSLRWAPTQGRWSKCYTWFTFFTHEHQLFSFQLCTAEREKPWVEVLSCVHLQAQRQSNHGPLRQHPRIPHILLLTSSGQFFRWEPAK